LATDFLSEKSKVKSKKPKLVFDQRLIIKGYLSSTHIRDGQQLVASS